MISDEIYSELTYNGKRHVTIASFPGMKERTVLINGFSKAYAMTGWRLGYAAAPHIILEQMLKIHQYAIMCAPTTSQYAAVSAMKNGDPDVSMMRESYNQRRRFLLHQPLWDDIRGICHPVPGRGKGSCGAGYCVWRLRGGIRKGILRLLPG